ncbi:MAG: helix-turn-helix transcriptional regulator [Bacteroidota bacterium]
MSLFKSINIFLKNLSKKIRYKDGFFEIPYMAGSPEMTIKSFDKLYFTKHDKKGNKIVVKNLFMEVVFYYLKLDDGLWIYISKSHYNKNMQFFHYYLKENLDNYYFLNFNQNFKTIRNKKMVVNGLCVSNKNWVLFKPLIAKSICHFKGTDELNVTINFNQGWLDKQLTGNDSFIKSSINSFLNSDVEYLSWPYSENDKISFDEFFECISIKEKGFEKKIKTLTLKCFDVFLSHYSKHTVNNSQFQFSDADRKKIQIATQFMLDNICGKAVTIEMICGKIGMSPTKFKVLFKRTHGNSVYQYYRDKKLEYAHELIQKSEQNIKQIANHIGYENAGKFTLAYKKKYGSLPSKN